MHKSRLRVAIILAAVSALLCAPCFAVQKRTIKRMLDPVIVTGAQLSAFKGSDIDSLRVYASKNGKLSPVPFQIDERGPDGNFVFKGGKDSDNGHLDANDELVFMVRDAGGTADKKAWPKGVSKSATVEIRDPVDGGKAWIYIFSFKGKAPARSERDYAGCTSGCNRIDAYCYEAGFSRRAPMAFDNLTIKKTCNGPGKDAMDRLKVRFHGETKLKIVIERHEEDFTSKVAGVIDGPVRVIRSTENRMVLVGRLPTPSSVSEQIYYADSFVFPIIVNVPVSLDTFMNDTWLRVTSESAYPPKTRFYNSRNKKGVLIDGKMSAEEKNLDAGSYNWQVVAFDAPPLTGAWLNRLDFDKKKTPARIELYYMDDITVKDPPDEYPGQIGNLGYYLKDVHRLGAGHHVLSTIMYAIPSYKPGDEARVMNVVDKPLKVTVK
jgi:hypothetical protein